MKILLKNLFIIILVLLYTGCDDGLSPNEVHTTEVKGFILESEGGIEVYSQFEGALSDTIAINVGDTLELSVHFLDHNGNEIGHEDGEEEHEDELVITENETTIAIIEVEEHCYEITNQTACESSEHCEWHADETKCEDEAHDDHDHSEEEEHHGLVIHITGVSVGSTSFKLELM